LLIKRKNISIINCVIYNKSRFLLVQLFVVFAVSVAVAVAVVVAVVV
jgi:hypothetical protein